MRLDEIVEMREPMYRCVLRINTPRGNSRRAAWTQKETRAAINRVEGIESLEEVRGRFGPWTVKFSGSKSHCLDIRRELSANLNSISRGAISMRFNAEIIA